MSSSVKLKTITFNITDKHTQKILNGMTKISKNIYNTTIFNITIFNKYKQTIFKKIYDELSSLQIDEKNKYDIHKRIYELYDINYKEYVNNIPIIKNNSKIIYKFITECCDTSYIINDFYKVIKYLVEYNIFKNNEIIYNDQNKYEVVDSIIEKILQSIYNKNYYRTYYQLINKEPITLQNEIFINQVKNNEKLFDTKLKIDWKKKIENVYKLKICSDNNIIGRVVYSHLNDDNGQLPSDLIINIVQKAYNGYKTFYALKDKGIKCNTPKYIPKDGSYILPYYPRSFKIIGKDIRLTVGENISKNYLNIIKDDKLVCLNSNDKSDYKYYVSKNKMKLITKKKVSKQKNYIVNNKYIDKNNKHIINAYYVNIKIPEYIKDKDIKLIEIKPIYENYSYKICMTYEEKNETKEVKSLHMVKDSISIDLGMANLMSIYDPIGVQYLLKGGYLIWLNKKYNNLIDMLKNKAKKCNNLNTTKQIRKLLIERENNINNYFNNIVKWISTTYKDKTLVIIGYNKRWKDRIDLGRNVNRKFYQIPYCRLLDKLNDKLNGMGIKVSYNEESYTSKCDALSLEEISKKITYTGKRIKRGLFSSSSKKLINADINGAINIMRKYYKKNGEEITEISGTRICNPKSVKIPCEVDKPAGKGN